MKKGDQIAVLQQYVAVLKKLVYEHHKTSFTVLPPGAQCPVCLTMNEEMMAVREAAGG